MAFSKLALLALAVGARAADDDQVVVGQTFMAGAIDPTSGSTGWALTSHGISEKLFTVDKDGEIVGQVAESVERVSDNVWEVKHPRPWTYPFRRAVVLVLRSGLPRKNSSRDSSRPLTSDTNSTPIIVGRGRHLAARGTSKLGLGDNFASGLLGQGWHQIHALVAAQRATTTGQPR